MAHTLALEVSGRQPETGSTSGACGNIVVPDILFGWMVLCGEHSGQE